MKSYQGKISYLLPILIIPALFNVGIIIEREFNFQSIMTLCLVWIFSLALLFLPLLYKLEIREDFIRKTFLGFTTSEFSSYEVESATYGGIALWNGVYPSRTIIHGNGLAILVNIQGIRKVYGFSEKLYGKDAIESIKHILKK